MKGVNILVKQFDEAISFLPPRLKQILSDVSDEIKEKTYEVRLRTEKCIVLITSDGVIFADKGKVTYIHSENLHKVTRQDINETFNRLCDYSVYSHSDSIVQGFITIHGGHRVGICGTAVTDNGRITSIRSISSLNIRIAREFRGCADKIIAEVFRKGLTNIIIAGPPSSGKTTLLRDIVRQISSGISGVCHKVTVVDERCEIAPVNDGICVFDLGFNTDILSSFPKAEGIMCALRTLSPDMIVCDEIGTNDECESVKCGLNSGICFALSIHASDIYELKNKPQFRLLAESGVDAKIVILGNKPCTVKEFREIGEMYDENNCSFSCCNGFDSDRAVC